MEKKVAHKSATHLNHVYTIVFLKNGFCREEEEEVISFIVGQHVFLKILEVLVSCWEFIILNFCVDVESGRLCMWGRGRGCGMRPLCWNQIFIFKS